METEKEYGNKKLYYIIMLGMELGLVFIGWSIHVFSYKGFVIDFINKEPVWLQLAAGSGAGMILGVFTAYFTIKADYFREMKQILSGLISYYRMNYWDVFILALVSGICEEILFRGVVQSFLGIWFTSFIFIFIHGYFNPKSRNMMFFGMLMFLVSALIGYFYEYLGMAAAMSFHFVFDLVILLGFMMFVIGKGEKNAKA
ncbi:MAG: CPBP family intramembrane glutamic endopeptidase [Candidatus Goldiibacteriota bacterium]